MPPSVVTPYSALSSANRPTVDRGSHANRFEGAVVMTSMFYADCFLFRAARSEQVEVLELYFLRRISSALATPGSLPAATSSSLNTGTAASGGMPGPSNVAPRRRPEHLVRQTEAPPVRKPAAQDIREDALRVLADPSDGWRAAHQGLRERLARAGP